MPLRALELQPESYKKFDLVTVVYSKELDYLEIQARSIELYVPREYINNIIVITNDPSSAESYTIDPSWYGINADKLKIINYRDWGFSNSNLDNHSLYAGWENQQLCKLLVSQNVESEWYYVLDAKTWFVNPIQYEKLFSKDGKSNNKRIPVNKNFDTAVPAINQQFGIDLKQAIGPGGVPFCFHTDSVKEMITHITTVANPTEKFHDFFLSRVAVSNPNPITEFMLYSGYLLKKYGDYKSLYIDDETIFQYFAQNVSDTDTAKFDELLIRMHDFGCMTVSVHKRALVKLKLYQLRNWIGFLTEKNLVLDN